MLPSRGFLGCQSRQVNVMRVRRSTSGYCITLGGNLVLWKSKKQNVVARSSAEVGFRAVAKATTELVELKLLLEELGFSISKSMNFWCDNQAALHITNNPVFYERTKHIELDCHFICDKVKEIIGVYQVRDSSSVHNHQSSFYSTTSDIEVQAMFGRCPSIAWGRVLKLCYIWCRLGFTVLFSLFQFCLSLLLCFLCTCLLVLCSKEDRGIYSRYILLVSCILL